MHAGRIIVHVGGITLARFGEEVSCDAKCDDCYQKYFIGLPRFMTLNINGLLVLVTTPRGNIQIKI